MRILFFLRSLGAGGAERQVALMAKSFVQRGHTVGIAVFYGKGAFEQELADAGVHLFHLEKKGRWDVVNFMRSLYQAIDAFKPSILYSCLTVANLLSAIAKIFFRNLKATRIVWGVRSSYTDQSHQPWVDRVGFKVMPLLSKIPHLIIFNSHAGFKNYVKLGYPVEKMRVVNNGFDTKRFCIDSEARGRFRDELKLHADAIIVGIVGRLDPIKDHPSFLTAAKIVLEAKPGTFFAIIGDGPRSIREELEVKAHQLGIPSSHLLWLGMRTDMGVVYNGLDLVCLCSLSEGFPNVLAEAMLCGTPCVSTEVGDVPFIVGNTGIITPVQQPQALAHGLLEMIGKLKTVADLRRPTRQHIIDNFSAQKMVDLAEEMLAQ